MCSLSNFPKLPLCPPPALWTVITSYSRQTQRKFAVKGPTGRKCAVKGEQSAEDRNKGYSRRGSEKTGCRWKSQKKCAVKRGKLRRIIANEVSRVKDRVKTAFTEEVCCERRQTADT
ncbi:hypothetical protein CDAR_499371 [Caerostris darwini]|uniref:Uncharacterized protein n=1 Tax=Caerostris darwini TaxID=1538125 RepID=A0AAV4P5H5_9ARAC|nr:hypothetical protein CDAR_499371 [Caerostris darwini]